MDIKTLLIATLAVSLTTSLCMALVFWTRQTYSGFGLWVAGHLCVMVSVALFMLPRDHFPPWLTIILANYLWFASMMLNNRGNLAFRSRRIGYGWEMAASVSFCALFAYFTYFEPSIAARLTVIALYHGGFQLWTITVLLRQRPVYFGSSDVLQVVSLGILVAINIMRAEQVWISGGSIPHQAIALQPFIDMILLGTMVVMLMLTLSQIMMNVQRLEYDYRIAQERLDLALDGGNTGLYAAHLLTGETFVDKRHQRLLGYRPGEMVFTVQNWLEHIHPQDQPPLLERYEEVAKGSRPTFESEYRVRHRDGTWRWVLDRGKSFDPDERGRPKQVTGTLMDITERKQAEEALNRVKYLLEEAQRLAKVGSWQWEIATDTVIWSEELYRIFDRDPNRPPPTYQEHSQIYTAESMVQLEAAVTQALDHGIPYTIDLELIRPDGSTKWVIGRGEPQYDVHRQIVGLRGTCMDITERHRLEEALREQAIRDPLTGLFNRRYLDETLHRELHRCQRDHQPLAVAMLDIDHFKHFNDIYGHEAGDAVLHVVGGLLRRSLRTSDIACRYGGEELTLILPSSTRADAVVRLESLRQAIQQQRTRYRDTDLPVITVSIGVAAMQPEDTDAPALLGRADAALYQAKAQGRNRVVMADGTWDG